jgi:hypothetical protein
MLLELNVEGTRGEIFAASHWIAIPMQVCTQWMHSDVWSLLATTLECLFILGDRQNGKKWPNSDRRAICNATRVVLMPGVGYSATGVSLIAPTERVHSGGAIPPGRKCFWLRKEVVAIETCQQKTSCANTEGECTPCWSPVDWARVSATEGPDGEIHLTCFFGSMKSWWMVGSMFFVSVWSHGGSQQRFWTMVQLMGTWYLGGVADFPMAERDIVAHPCKGTCGVSRTWWR